MPKYSPSRPAAVQFSGYADVVTGRPMLVAGDELGRTQQGNNNAYCQDNEISWIDWAHVDQDLHEFTKRLIAFRHFECANPCDVMTWTRNALTNKSIEKIDKKSS